MKSDFPEQQAVTHAYDLLMKSLAMIFRDIHKGSYYQSSDPGYYKSLLTDTKFFENFKSYLSIIQSSHLELATNSLSTALNYANLLCNPEDPEQKTIPNNVEPNRLIQEHIWDPIWNFHYAMMNPLREKNPVHEKKSIPKPSELPELPDELWKHTLSFFGWRHQLNAVKLCSQQFKSWSEDSSLNVPYSILNYQHRLDRKYEEQYFEINTVRPVNCSVLMSDHSFLTGEGKALFLYDFRKTTKDFFGESHATIKELKGHNDDVTSICILSHNKAVSGSKDKTLRIWDLLEGKCLKTLQGGHTAKINCVIMLSEQMILSADEDKQLISWDLENQENQNFEIITKTKNPILNMIKLDDNRIVYATSHDLAIFGLKDKQWVKIDSGFWGKCTIDSICLPSPDTLLVSLKVVVDDDSFFSLTTFTSVVKVFDISENCLKAVHDIRHENRSRFAGYMQSLPSGIIAFLSGYEPTLGSNARYKVLSFYNLTEKKFLASYELTYNMHTYISALPDNRIVLYDVCRTFNILPFAHLEFKNKALLEMEEPKRCLVM